MNGIMGMTGLILDTDLTTEQEEYAETIKNSAQSLLSIINDILDFSKIESGKLDLETLDFDLRTTLDDLGDSLALSAHAKGLELLCWVEPEVPALLRGDPGRLRQILTNLLNNAIKFTSSGEVSLRVSLDEEDAAGARIRFEVKDTGIGIPKDKIVTLFQPFTQVDASITRRYGGTGLGLSISRQLTERMGGDIGVESEEGKGSTFWVSLPLVKQTGLRKSLEDVDINIAENRILVGVIKKRTIGSLQGCLIPGIVAMIMPSTQSQRWKNYAVRPPKRLPFGLPCWTCSCPEWMEKHWAARSRKTLCSAIRIWS